MFGFIIGTVCLIALVKVLRRGRGVYGHRGYGCHHGHGGYDAYDGDESAGPGARRPRRWLLRSLFERLETTPGQEKAIVAALDELRDNRKGVRGELQQTRGDLARAVASGLVDDATLEETFARHDRLLAQLRVSLVEGVKKVTETLDERQRKQLARWLEGGAFRGGPRWGGPYRGGMWA
jgi:Spy/CpxP family protein refolding chaperone